ncbi:MAG: chemotaxis protein CheA [Bacteroidales bacterium]|nr:chemotaxis protein CheA [Bacteroidales bacterium]
MFENLKILFFQEVKELLSNTEQNLLLLENDKTNKEILEDIFRTMHTIKGSAGVYNLEKTVRLSHSFESLFSKIKDGKVAITNEIISLALNAKDIILTLIEAESEGQAPDKEIEEFISKVVELNSKIVEEKEEVNQQKLFTFYIVFEPNSDLVVRGINVNSILSDFDEFEQKKISTLSDKNRKESNKDEKYYEIIVASEYSLNDLMAIFLFTPNEVTIEKISNFNIFNNPDFIDFYENAVNILPDIDARKNLILNFVQTIEEDQEALLNIEETKEEKILIGADEIIEEIKKTEGQQVQYIKVPAEKLDELLNLVSELIISNSQLADSAENKDFNKIKHLSENISKTTNSIKENTLELRLIPIKNILPPYQRIVRDLSLKLGKKINFIEDGIYTQVDKTIIDKLFNPLLHIIRNSIDHGIETPTERVKKGKHEEGVIRFIAYNSNSNVIVQVQDDGKGIDPEFIRKKAIERGLIQKTDKLTKKEIYELLFIHGFTTSDEITDISGRGVGMDAIKKAIQDLRGDIEIDSEVELGTSVTIKLPLTLSIIETLHVSTEKMHFLLPVTNIETCMKIKPSEINDYSGKRIIINEELIPYVDIRKLFKIGGERLDEENLIIVNHGRQKIGLIFDNIQGEYQAVIKNMGNIFTDLDYFIGASILGNGAIAYILDSYKLLKKLK